MKIEAVSYTHLDVYKRQILMFLISELRMGLSERNQLSIIWIRTNTFFTIFTLNKCRSFKKPYRTRLAYLRRAINKLK